MGRSSVRATPSAGENMANVITSPTQLLGSFFIVLTNSGETAIAFSELAAITKRGGITGIGWYDIHLKSGTIFTTLEIPQTLKDSWFNAN